MGQSTDGQICFGVLFEEDHVFPWDSSPWRGDIAHWWRDQNGYKHPFQLYDNSGEYVGGQKPPDEQITAYYQHRFAWQKANPLPIKMVNCFHGDYPIWIIALPETCLDANRGSPIEFDPSSLNVTADQVATLTGFCERWNVGECRQPRWLLSSYWG